MEHECISLSAEDLSRRVTERSLQAKGGSKFVLQDLFPNWYQLGTRMVRRNAGALFFAKGRVVPGVRPIGKTARGQQIYFRD